MTHALLIDGENVGSHAASAILKEIPQDSPIRRVYGDVVRLNGWTKVYGLSVRHVSPGPDATDMAIAIDALSLCHRDGYRHFTIATGDADFVPVLTHLRESGCTIHLAAPPNTAATLKAVAHRVLPLPPKAVPAPAPKPPATPVAVIQTLVKEAGPSGLPMATLSVTLQKLHPAGLSDWLGFPGPRKFLEAYAGLFVIDRSGSHPVVRLALSESGAKPVADLLESFVIDVIAQTNGEGCTVGAINKAVHGAGIEFPPPVPEKIVWLQWLKDRPHLFRPDPPGPGARVRTAF